MYAHQIIESLDFIQKVGDPAVYDKKLALDARNRIANAQKFNIGELAEFINIFQKDTSKFYVSFEHEFKMPPYDLIWIDYTNGNAKTGLLVHKWEDIVFIIPFIGMNEDKGFWYPQIHMFRFRLDSETGAGLKQNPLLKSDYSKQINESQLALFFNTATVYSLLNKFLDCKNIETADNLPPDKLNKKRAKKNKPPLYTYKTLVLKPTGKQQKSIPRHLWENRIHLCRGHFKTYTEDAPLFGRYTGRYWWQPSVRGNKSKGVVMKDYKVKSD